MLGFSKSARETIHVMLGCSDVLVFFTNGKYLGGRVLCRTVKLGLGLMHGLGMITHHSEYSIGVLLLSRCPITPCNTLDTEDTKHQVVCILWCTERVGLITLERRGLLNMSPGNNLLQ